MRLVSKHYNLLSYTDGRNGSPDEATIYTTFFKDFTGISQQHNKLEISFPKLDCDDAKKTLDNSMEKIDNSTINQVDYCGGYNEIVCFDRPQEFETTSIILPRDITKEVSKEESIIEK